MLGSTSPTTARRVLASLALPGTIRLGAVGDPVQRLASGWPALDAALGGGLPRGRLSEITGPVTSGKTTLLLAFLAAATQHGETTALIDFPDSLHPETAHAAGIELPRLLWVRPPSLPDGLRCTELLLDAGGFGFVAMDLGAPPPWQLRAPVWPRLVRVAERTKTTLVLVAERRVAGSFAAMSLTLNAPHHVWSHGAWPLFDGIQVHVAVTRNKLGPPGRSVLLQAAAGDPWRDAPRFGQSPISMSRMVITPDGPSADGRLSTMDC